MVELNIFYKLNNSIQIAFALLKKDGISPVFFI